MTREEAKAMFRNDKDAYGKPRGVMRKINQIYDDFEQEIEKKALELLATYMSSTKPKKKT